MAVFLENRCKYTGCGRSFSNLADLIHHIENYHIERDPRLIEQMEASHPSCVALSYVQRYFPETIKIESPPVNPETRRRLASVVRPPSIRSITPTESEHDDEDMGSGRSEDSNDPWTNGEKFSAEYILRHGTRNNSSASANGLTKDDKPFACPVPGCKKRYKNINGIKYHSQNGHKKGGRIKKGYRCDCGKSYKTDKLLKKHSANHRVPVVAPSARLAPLPGAHVFPRLVQNIKYETEIETQTKIAPNHVNISVDNILQFNSLGILTPAASPVSTANERSIRIARGLEDGAAFNLRANPASLSPPAETHLASPPGDDSLNRFHALNSMH